MKPLTLALIAAPFLAFTACGQKGPSVQIDSGSTGTGGSSSTGGGSGTTGAGGTSSTGGTGGTGGTSSTGGTGGSSSTGGTGGGTGGTTGTGGTGGSAVTVDTIAGIPNSFGDSLKNSFILFPCLSQQNQDCITFAGTCPNQNGSLPYEQQGMNVSEVFTLGGTPGTMYLMTIVVNGISEGKYYELGARSAGDTMPANVDAVTGIDTFYTGGQPVNFENYNVYKLTVKTAAGAEVQHYYLNSMPKVATAYENHNTFPMAFTHQIPVPGGGSVQYYMADRNCHAVDNCGAGSRSTTCAVAAGRNVPNEPALVIPTTYLGQPVTGINTRNGAAQPYHSHIFHITVTAVTPM